MSRRLFLSRLAASTALLGSARQGSAASQAVPAPPQSPLRHPQDAWLDQTSARHKVVFDTWFSDRFNESAAFAANYFKINKTEYGLTDADLAVVLVLRHGTGPYAFNEAIWAKYGGWFAAHQSGADVKAHPNPGTNVYAARLTAMVKQGLQLAVCNLTTHGLAQALAKDRSTDADAMYKELTSNTLGNAHFVPAGVVAVTRAQEHGYALVSVG
jgi:intracellular sulfur oxidation DsrE/DsrF family protein